MAGMPLGWQARLLDIRTLRSETHEKSTKPFRFSRDSSPRPSRAAIREICLYAHPSLPIQISLIAAFRPVVEILKSVIGLRPAGSGLHPASRAIAFLSIPCGD